MKLPSKILAIAAVASGLATAAPAAVETYTIDPVHSAVGFSIRHFVSKVPGRFTQFSGTITVDRDNLENSSVEATIDVGSLNTFKSTSCKKTGDATFDVTGNLTIKGISKEVVLKVTLLGFGPGMRGAQLSGWEASTTILKADVGVTGPAMLGKALCSEVALSISLHV